MFDRGVVIENSTVLELCATVVFSNEVFLYLNVYLCLLSSSASYIYCCCSLRKDYFSS